jgi:hypothetical protein
MSNFLERRIVNTRNVGFRLKLNAGDRERFSNFVQLDLSDGVDPFRRDSLLGHADESLESSFKLRSGKNFRIVAHEFAPPWQVLESSPSDARPGTNDTRLGAVRKELWRWAPFRIGC